LARAFNGCGARIFSRCHGCVDAIPAHFGLVLAASADQFRGPSNRSSMRRCPARPSEDEGRNGEAWWRLAARLASDSPIDFRSALGSHLKWAGGRIVLRFIRFAKITVLASAVWTIFCATFIFSWQLISWFRSGSWDFFPISWAVLPIKYTTASAGQNSPQPTVLQYVVDQLLEIPAIVPLAIASALLFGFYIRLSIIERQLQ
jgi:hypothetical protein